MAEKIADPPYWRPGPAAKPVKDRSPTVLVCVCVCVVK